MIRPASQMAYSSRFVRYHTPRRLQSEPRKNLDFWEAAFQHRLSH